MPPQPSPAVTYILAAISSAVSLALTQSLITSQTAQIITGAAAVLVPLVLAALNTLLHAAHTVKPPPPVAPAPVFAPAPVPEPPSLEEAAAIIAAARCALAKVDVPPTHMLAGATRDVPPAVPVPPAESPQAA
jgi:hypothetical protein